MDSMPPMLHISRTLSICEVSSPGPATVRNVMSMDSAKLSTYAGRAPSRLTTSMAASITGIALTLMYRPTSMLSVSVSTPAMSSTNACCPDWNICGAKR